MNFEDYIQEQREYLKGAITECFMDLSIEAFENGDKNLQDAQMWIEKWVDAHIDEILNGQNDTNLSQKDNG